MYSSSIGNDEISFISKVTDWLIFGEVIKAEFAVRVIPKTIPHMEQKLLCATFLEAILRFYENPENMAAFEVWCAEKGGSVNGQKDS